jgi:hypothetical protein
LDAGKFNSSQIALPKATRGVEFFQRGFEIPRPMPFALSRDHAVETQVVAPWIFG